MGVIEVNFQTTKKMNRLGSGFDLCTLTKKKDHSLSCSQQRAEENAVNFTFYQPLCSTKPLSSNTVLLSSFFSLSSFFRFFPNLTGFFTCCTLHCFRPWGLGCFSRQKTYHVTLKRPPHFDEFFFQTVCRQGLLSCDLQTRESYVPPGWGSCARLALDTKLLTQSLHAPVHHMTCPGKSGLH